MNPNPKETIELSMGDKLQVYEQSIVVGPVAIFLNREVERKDVEAVITIYTAGMAARSRMLNKICNTFIEVVSNVEIGGYSDKEAQQWTKGERDD